MKLILLKQEMKRVLESASKFGNEYIILPNPTYGDWEGIIYNNNWSSTPEEQDSMRKHIIDSLYKSSFLIPISSIERLNWKASKIAL